MVVGIAGLVSIGCRRAKFPEKPPSETVQSELPNRTKSQNATRPEAFQSLAQGAGDAHLMSLNPNEDGWDTEYLNVQAGAQLKALGKLVTHFDSSSPKQIETLLADSCSCSNLRPTNSEQVYDDGTMHVLRSLPRGKSGGENFVHQGKPGVVEALRNLAKPFADAVNVRSKFKIIRVLSKEDVATTEQLFEISGQTPEGIVEFHATWSIQWSLTSGSQPPLIRSIQLLDFEAVTARTGGGPLFSDCTESVFRDEPEIFVGQLSVGIPGWIRRLESYLKSYQFGHNGIALGDVNGDGLDDVYLCQIGGLPNRLLLHQPDGTVQDASKSAGVDFLDNTRSALFVDLDNDGDQDLVMTHPSEILLMANDGSGKFELQARVRKTKHAFSLAAADYDQDGDLDLLVCVYFATGTKAAELPVPMPFYNARNGGRNVLLKNEGDWKFVDATDSSGLEAGNSRFSYAAVWEDYDNDGDQDLFVANDFGPNNLYRNDGGRFTEVTAEVGMLDSTFGMSADSADFNRDGWFDIYKANMFSSAGTRVTHQSNFMPEADAQHKQKFRHLARGNTLFENQKGKFKDVSVARGVTMGRWSWGSVFMDFNNDGWEDIFIANGFITGGIPDDL